MGPHPETPVDVQKYIGTCLITQQPRSKRKSCPRGVGQPPPHHPHKDGPGYVQGGCCTKGNGGGFNSMTNYAWTGVPLISVARQGGKSHHSHPGKNRGSPPGRNSMKQQQQQSQDYFESSSVVDGCLEEILPISRLAIHAQGAPLILSPKDSPGEKAKELEGYPVPFKGPDFYHLGSEGRLYMFMTGSCSPDDPLYLHPPPHQRGGGERTPSSSSSGSSCCYPEDDPESGGSRAVASSPSRSSDCGTSTTSEDSGTSENGLPRILKPRKRRKKDRRMSEGDAAHGAESQSPHQGTIVTLKPYQPLCYRYSGSGGAFKAAPSSSKSASASNKSSEGESGGLQRGAYPYPPSSRCRCPHCVPPPSTLLTPPDSPVAAEEGLLASARRKTNDFVVLPSEDTTHSADASLESFKSQNALVLPSSHPPPRPWIQVSNRSPQSSCSFTVMCYNILCDKYATRQMYGYCPNWALEWSYRKRNILNEIIHYKADIISLQEVETEQFYKYFLPELKKEGYDGIFSPKSRAKTMSESERKHVDGCAIFYKTDKFFLLKEHLVEFNQLAMANAEGSDDMLNRVMTKDNIGLAALLQTRMGAYELRPDMNQTSQTLLVCTAHIHWDPEYSDVKLIQTMMLMHELKAFVDDILHKCNIPASQKSDPNIIPLLLCGDFNSLPDSGVIEYLSSGRVSTSHIDFKEIVYKDCLSKLGNPTNSNEFTHPFQITRAYKDGIMPFTNYSYDFKGVIDYVFYSKLHMNVLGVLGPIDSGWLDENHIHGCPHPHVPSDHFPIVVELQLYPTTSLHPQQPPNGVSLHR